MKTITLGSLFDGSGGFPLAGSLCGIEPKWAAEVEPYPVAVTRSRFPSMKQLGSVTDIHGGEIEHVDIITFGSPCQDLSVGGKRRGLKHEANGDGETTRSGLFMEAVRIIKEMREATNGECPSFALWENVPGAFSSNNGEDFRTVLAELIGIVEPDASMPPVPKAGWAYADSYRGDGWSLAYRVFDAQYWGVPQRRRRIHLVLDLRGERAREVLFEREGVRGHFEACGAQGQEIASDSERGAGTDDRKGGVGCLTPWDYQSKRVFTPNGVFPTLQSGERSGQNQQAVCICTGLDLCNFAFQPVAYSFDSLASNSMKSKNPNSGCRQVENAKTLDTTDPNPNKNQGGIAIVESAPYTDGQPATPAANNDQYLFRSVVFRKGARPHSADEAQKWEEAEIANTLNTFDRGETRANELVIEAIPIHDQATRFAGKRGDKSDGKGNGLGVGKAGDPMNTLTSADRHAVAFQTYQKVNDPLIANSHPGSYTRQDAFRDILVAEPDPVVFDKEVYNSGENAAGGHYIAEAGPAPTLRTGHPPGVAVRRIVRRLTPTECARLQGFDDRWGDIDKKDGLTAEEHRFWLNVRNTHAAINGKAVKDYTEAQTLTWYNKLHTDSAEYKMWGNGIALPAALYCMQGIAGILHGRKRKIL